MSRTLSCVRAGATAVLLATLATGSSLAAAPSATSAAPPAPRTWLYDRAVDPATAAIKAALAETAKRQFLDKRDRAGLVAYYAATGNAPIWTAEGKLSERALALIARLKQADLDGLDMDVFETPDVAIGVDRPASLIELARADVLLTQSLVTYAHQARAGRLDPNTVSVNISYPQHLPDPVAVLSALVTAADPAAALAAFNPKHPEFWALRDALATARATAATTVKPPVIAPGNVMRLGYSDARVPVLRARLGVAAPEPDPKTPTVMPDLKKFDPALAAAVVAFQKEQGLNGDGAVGPATLAALNAAADDHIALILANMERWRWMPEELGAFYVRVNVPNYNLNVYQNGEVVWTTRIVDGKVTNQTPIFSDEIETVVVNPVWNVPASIAVKEMLPDVLANPYALSGYDVYYNFNGRYQQVNPLQVDWRRVDMSRVQIKQPPGPANALGSVKFLFPNPFDVYLHDTPSKSLFGQDYRALSHGCMRVQDPWAFAEVLLAQQKGLSAAALRKMVGGPEQQFTLPTRIPVHITYFTAWVDASGSLQVRGDVYGHDATVQRGLGLQSS